MMTITNIGEIKKKLGVTGNMAKIDMTPEQAKWVLKHCNWKNRRLRRDHVNQLRKDMESGHWYNDVDYIGFDADGTLINGQHRLKALSEASVTSISLKVDFDVEQHVSMDTGMQRKYHDQAAIASKNGLKILNDDFKRILLAAMRLENPKCNPTNSEWLKLAEMHSECLERCDSAKMFDLGKLQYVTPVKAALLLASLNGIDMNVLSHFAKVLKDGITTSDTDIPIIRLRDELLYMKGSGREKDSRRAKLTQQTLYNVITGVTSNRLPSNPQMLYRYEF